jgi:hypothetical protein
VIDNVVWTDSWLSIACAGCGLICVGAGEEQARKVITLRGLLGVERQVGSARWTRWPNGIKCGPHGGKKSKMKSWQELVQGCDSPESAHGVCGGSQQNRRVTWLSHKTKTGGSTDGDGIWARREASMPGNIGIAGLASGGRGLR